MKWLSGRRSATPSKLTVNSYLNSQRAQFPLSGNLVLPILLNPSLSYSIPAILSVLKASGLNVTEWFNKRGPKIDIGRTGYS